ncbi:MAG TPA: sigma 54-interacting transcriptional regulator, partial [Kofleriaceae bacterium]|nr:sigma 54-interacting transcriptional regulator [Kofleriaceae bacterium]
MVVPTIGGRRGWQLIHCLIAAGFVAAVAVTALGTADLGFFSFHGGAVLAVTPDGPAARAGIEPGDVITAVDGVPVSSPREVERALESVEPGARVVLRTRRGEVEREATLAVASRQPWTSISAAIFGGLILLFALLADRGGPEVAARAFYREALASVFVLAGAFSWETALATPWLALPWIASFILSPALSCPFMMLYPAGPPLDRRQLRLLYIPPLAAVACHWMVVTYFFAGGTAEDPGRVWVIAAVTCLVPPLYLPIGALLRFRRIQAAGGGVPRAAVRWVQCAALLAAAPIPASFVWALVDLPSLLFGGFRLLMALSVVGGGACSALALTHAPLGASDEALRGRAGTLVATCLAAALFLAFLIAAGGASSALSGGVVPAVMGATVVAAALFGPLRERIQRAVEGRLTIDRERERRLLREVTEATRASTDLAGLAEVVARAVQGALAIDGAAIYEREGEAGWRRIACSGALPERFDPAAELPPGMLAQRAGDHERAWIIAAAPGRLRPLGEDDRAVLATVAVQLEVAFRRARDRSRLARLRDAARRRERQLSLLAGRIQEEERRVRGRASHDGRGIAVGAGLRPVFEQAQRVGRSDAVVLIRGETGAGKEVIARAIHAASARREQPFVVVECAALASGLAESTLFGHERGAFTGAVRSASGAFRAASGGTLFLDEVGDLPPELQPKLLRALEEGTVTPLGSTEPVVADVRILAATRRDLERLIADGRFREDLCYRLRVVELSVPPLRARPDDILPLAEHFLALAAERTGGPPARLTPAARDALRAHPWPG